MDRFLRKTVTEPARSSTEGDNVDECFEAYRSGLLAPSEEQGLEKRLALDGAARRRLALGAGIGLLEASPELRQRLLDAFLRHCRPRTLEMATRMANEAPS